MIKNIIAVLAVVFAIHSASILKGEDVPLSKLPTADEFPITFWAMYYWPQYPEDYKRRITDEQYKLIKECNFNLLMGGPAKQAEKYGLKFMYAGLQKRSLKSSLWRPPYDRALNPKVIKKIIGSIKKAPVKSPAFWGYVLADEPKPPLFNRVAWIANIIKAIDNKHPVFTNLLPGANPDVFFDAVRPSILAYDHYPIFGDGGVTIDGNNSQKNTPAGFDQSSFLISLVRFRKASVKYNVKFIPSILLTGHKITYMYKKKKYQRDYGKMTEGKIRWQAFSSIAYGAGGIGWFTYFSGRGDPNREQSAIGLDWKPTKIYWWLKQTNLETGLLYREFQKYVLTNTWEMAPTYFWKKSHNKEVTFFTPQKLLRNVSGGLFTISEFKSSKRKERLLFVVNRDVTKACKAVLDFNTKFLANIQIFNKGKGTWGKKIPASTANFNIAPGDSLLLKLILAPVFEEKIELDDELAKSDAWKLKKSWTMEKGNITGSARGSSFLFLKKKENLSEVEFEAEITPVKVKGSTWKAAGIVLYKSPVKYWQLTFLERPDKAKNAKGHYIELKCKLGKWWGAERRSKSKQLADKNFKWEYGKTYKFKLKLSPGRIDGFVYPSNDGSKVLAHIAFELKDGAVETGMPALRCIQMKAAFSKLKFKGKSF